MLGARKPKTRTERYDYLDFQIKCNIGDWNPESGRKRPELDLTLYDFSNAWGYPLKYAKPVRLDGSEQQTGDDDTDFIENYPDIVRGKRPDWVLDEVKIYAGTVELCYLQTEFGKLGYVSFFRCPKFEVFVSQPVFPGGTPLSYSIKIHHYHHRLQETVIVEENKIFRRKTTYRPQNSDSPEIGRVITEEY